MSTKKEKTNSKLEVSKSVFWLIETTFRVFVGIWLLTHSSNFLIIALAIYGLAGAGVIVVAHFVTAHKA